MKGIEIGTASRPKPGEIECGDQFVVVENARDVVVAVADGLGHGPEAAIAGKAACQFVRENPHGGLEDLMRSTSKAISHTRGVALSLLRFNPRAAQLDYAGIGNVDVTTITRGPVRPFNQPGVVGSRIRRVSENSYELSDGDLIVVYSDGISSRFDLSEYRLLPASSLAQTILQNHAKDHDDATCVAIRYRV